MKKSNNLAFLDDWSISILADPITKLPKSPDNFDCINGVLDARVFLKNTYGYHDWKIGQDFYESWEASGDGYKNEVESYRNEIRHAKPIYDHFHIYGDILDVGGLTGTAREMLPKNIRYISLDPFINAPYAMTKSKMEAYKCLKDRLNFIAGMAEFLPFQEESFDWVHMRSMLDHVQVPDLALKEAHRVLKANGRLIIGMYVDGGKTGIRPMKIFFKDLIKEMLSLFGIHKFKDFHTWHPSYKNLLKLIDDNGFSLVDSYWQPFWKDQVVYISASKKKSITI